MWVYKYSQEKSRTQVPKFWTFLRQNHDVFKLWFEDVTEAIEDRISFPLRLIRFISTQCLLFIFIYIFIGPKDGYYQQECTKR
jgi:hypothetical protein